MCVCVLPQRHTHQRRTGERLFVCVYVHLYGEKEIAAESEAPTLPVSMKAKAVAHTHTPLRRERAHAEVAAACSQHGIYAGQHFPLFTLLALTDTL